MVQKKVLLRILSLVLVCVLLAGCGDAERVRNYFIEGFVAYSDMDYKRPDMETIERVLAKAIEASEGKDLDELEERINQFYDVYDDFYTNYSLADSLSTMVEQAAFATFEQRMYELPAEALSVEGLQKLYGEVAELYGFDVAEYADWEFVEIGHFYTNPMYIISYVVSNDAALQLYQLEHDAQGAGLACFEQNLDTQALYFVDFLESAGLRSPFEEGGWLLCGRHWKKL